MLTSTKDVLALGSEKMLDLVLPDGEQVKETLSNIDIIVKIQMVLFEFHSVLYWMSAAEIVLFVLLLIFFIRAPGQMWFVFFHTPHLFRGFLG